MKKALMITTITILFLTLTACNGDKPDSGTGTAGGDNNGDITTTTISVPAETNPTTEETSADSQDSGANTEAEGGADTTTAEG